MKNEHVNLREMIKSEYKKCYTSPMHFMKKYVKIQHTEKGTIPFELYPFQEETLQKFIDNDKNVVLKSRQMGISTLVSAYSLWLMLFNTDKTVVVISRTQEATKEIITKIRFMNDNLPSWLKVPLTEDNRLSLRFKNGSSVKAVSSAAGSARGFACSLVILDECAFIPNAEDVWVGANATTSTGGKAIILSCVTEDTFIFTHKGLKQIQEFIPNNKIVGDYSIDNYEVLGVDTMRSGKLFKNSGVSDTIKIITKFGKLEGSKIHKVWAYKSDSKKFNWVELKDLTPNDYISLQYGMNIWGNNDDISNFRPSKSNKIKCPLNFSKISKELSYLFGLYISEGNAYKVLNTNKKLVGGNITISCGDMDICWVFDYLGLNYYTNDNLHYDVSSKNLIELFEFVGFDLSKTEHNKVIPSRLLEMSKENLIYLLRGIFDGDGCSYKGNISLSSTSEQLINQVRLLLNNMGILSSYYIRTKEQMNSYKCTKIKHNYDSHILEMYGKNSLSFFNVVGFCISRKQKNKELLLKQNLSRSCSHDVIPNSLELVRLLYKNSKENTKTMKNKFGISLNSIVNNTRRYKTENISRNIVGMMYNLYKHTLSDEDRDYYDNIISNNLCWTKIKCIQQSKNFVCDFSLPHDVNDNWCHSIIYNGFVGHQTPNGVGDFFHKMWLEAESKQNGFVMSSLPWHLHPERDQHWRDVKGGEQGDPRKAAQEFDCDFTTTGNTVISPEILKLYRTKVSDPIEKRWAGESLWIWKYTDYSHPYLVAADVARGDGADKSAFHVIDLKTCEQVAEFKGTIDTKSYGNLLVSIANEYNKAILVVENANVGWATLQQIIDLGYPDLFYSNVDLTYVDVERQMVGKINRMEKNMVPGFTTSTKNRPLLISNLESYFRDGSIKINSIRTIEELTVFIWNGAKAEAMKGYNDDLVMSLGIGLWIRDTALRLKGESAEFTKTLINNITRISDDKIYVSRSGETARQSWTMPLFGGFNTSTSTIRREDDDLRWLL